MSSQAAKVRIIRLIAQWGPVLALMALIFFASSLPKHVPAGGPSDELYFSGLMPVFPDPWELIIKKGAHLLVYALLALLSWRALRLNDLSPGAAAAGAIFIVGVYAASDELHQSMVAGRGASVRDVILDLIGGLLALAALYGVRRYRPQRTSPAPVTKTLARHRESHSQAP